MTQEPQNMAQAIAQAQQSMAGLGTAPQQAPNPFVQQDAFGSGSTPDFSTGTSKTPVQFKIDGDTFLARARIGGGVVLGLAKVAEIEDVTVQVGLIESFLAKVLLPGSLVLFSARLNGEPYTDPNTGIIYNNSAANPESQDLEPIELEQVLDVFKFLVARYTNGMAANGFPTPGSSPSAGGPLPTGLSSSGLAVSTGASIPGMPV